MLCNTGSERIWKEAIVESVNYFDPLQSNSLIEHMNICVQVVHLLVH